MRIKYKFTLILLFFTLLPILLGGFFLYEHSRQTLIQSTLENLRSIASAKETLIEEMIYRQEERVRLITNRPALRRQMEAYLQTRDPALLLPLKEILTGSSESIEWVRNIVVLDVEGRFIAASQDADVQTPLGKESLADARSGFHLFVRIHDGKRFIHLCGPLWGEGDILGIACIETNNEIFDKAVRDYTGLGETGEIVLARLDDQGNAVFVAPTRFRPAENELIILPPADPGPTHQALSKSQSVFLNTVDYRGEKVIAVTRYIEAMNWGLVVKKDKSEVFAPINHMGNINLGIILLMALIMVLVSLRGAAMVTGPISKLHDGVLKVSQGDLQHRVDITSRDEIGRLSVSFNVMAHKLQQMTDELRKRELELRRHNEILTTLNEIGLTLSGELDLHKLLQEVTEAATKLSGAEFGAFIGSLSNQESVEESLYAISGVTKEEFRHFFDSCAALFEFTFSQQTAIRIADVREDPRCTPKTISELPLVSYLAVPVISRSGQVLGGIFLGHSKPGVFKVVHEQMAGGLASQAAIAIDNARLVEDLKKAQEELKEANAGLEEKVRERTALAERRAGKLRELASALTLAEQKERRRLAQILHDHLQQMLIAARLGLTRLKRELHDDRYSQSIAQVEELLDSAVAASRSFTVELSPPVLRDAGLPAAVDWLARWFKEKHELTVDVHADPDLPRPSEDVKIFLFQAMRELLFNIVKHAGVDHASIHLISREKEIGIAVEDHGQGFNPEDLFKADVGFGLFHIRERLEMLGGRIEIESAAGHGALFRLYAPAEKEAPKRMEVHERETDADGDHGKKSGTIKVLVVDDHKMLRQGLINMLEGNRGIKVIGEAGDGEEAVKKAAELKPDVIIMDISMPRMNGIEATQRIKALWPGIQVIGLSLHDSEDMAETMRNAGANAYLSKSGPVDGLVKTIRDIASGKVVLRV